MNLKRIVLFKICGIGDAIQLTPLIAAINKTHSKCELIIITNKNGYQVLGSHPFVKKIIEIEDKYFFGPSTCNDFFYLKELFQNIRNIDIYINLQPNLKASVLTPFINAKRKIAIKYFPYKIPFYDLVIFCKKSGRDATEHVSATNLRLWSAFTGKSLSHQYDSQYLLKSNLNNKLHLPQKKYVCLLPGAGNNFKAALKKWPLQSWISLANLLAEIGYLIAWIGLKEDLIAIPKNKSYYLYENLAEFSDIAHILNKSVAVIGADTGLFHLSVGLNKKTLGLYGPTDPNHVGPFKSDQASTISLKSLSCIHCYQSACTHSQKNDNYAFCMEQISPELVFNRIKEMIKI